MFELFLVEVIVMQCVKTLILLMTILTGGVLCASSPQGIVADHAKKDLSVSSAVMLRDIGDAQIVRNCIQAPGHHPDLEVANKLPSPLPVKMHKKYKRGKAEPMSFELPAVDSACLVLDSINLPDVVQAGNFYSLSPLGVPGAVLSSRLRDMSSIMARE